MIPRINKTALMKINKIVVTSLVAGLLAAGLTACVSESANEAKLEAKAKIPKDQAQKTALAAVPNGTVKEGEIEEENGKLIWSFDVATPGTKDITEVNVDAISGEVVSKEIESASAEAKEKD